MSENVSVPVSRVCREGEGLQDRSARQSGHSGKCWGHSVRLGKRGHPHRSRGLRGRRACLSGVGLQLPVVELEAILDIPLNFYRRESGF